MAGLPPDAIRLPPDAIPLDAQPVPAAPAAPAKRPSTIDEQVVNYLAKLVGSETLADAATGTASLAGLFDPVLANIGAVGSYLVPYTSKPGATYGERVANEHENIRRSRAESFSRSPTAAMSGAVLPVMTGAIQIPTPVSNIVTQAPGAANALLRAGAGTADASLFTGLTNAGMNADKGYIDHFIEGATSPVNFLGAAPAAAELATIGASKAPGFAKMAPEAARLEAQGVTSQTLGQSLGRHHWYNKLEQAMESLPFTGPRLAAKRAEPALEVERVAQGMGTPPNQPRPTARGSAGIDEMDAAFKPAYAELSGWPMTPTSGHPGARGSQQLDRAFASAAKNGAQDVVMSPAARDSVARQLAGWWKEFASKAGKNGGVMSEDLISLRSTIRAARRKADAASTGNPDQAGTADILSRAESAVTRGLEGQLPNREAAHLAATDRAYANFTTLRKAQALSNSAVATVGESPTIAHLLRAGNSGASEGVRAGTPDFPIQQLFRDSAAVIPNTTATTGARAVTIAPLVAAGTAVGGAPGAALLPAGVGLGVNWAATSPLLRSIVFGGKGGAVAPMSLANNPFAGSLFAGQSRNPAPGYQTPAIKGEMTPAYAGSVPTPSELAAAHPDVNDALQRGGPSAAAAAFYSAAQTRPGQVLSWLNSP